MKTNYKIPNSNIQTKDVKTLKNQESNTTNNNLENYNELVYKLHKLKMTNPKDINEISKLEFQIIIHESKYNLGNIEKIDASLLALERYQNDLVKENELKANKKRGITIYEDLSYKLYKVKLHNSSSLEKIKKIETKLEQCEKKYELDNIEKIDAKLKAIMKYNENSSKKEENTKRGLTIYEELLKKIYNLKKEEKPNQNKIDNLLLKIKKCSNHYQLTNFDKLEIQIKLLEENN